MADRKVLADKLEAAWHTDRPTTSIGQVARDHLSVILATLRADTDPSLERVEAMREAAAKVVEVDPFFRTIDRFVANGFEVKNSQGHNLFVSTTNISDFIREKAAAIRALPVTNEGAGPC